MAKYEPIDLAPRDGTRVDLYVQEVYIRPKEYQTPGRRIADCYWRVQGGVGYWAVDGYREGEPVESDIFGGCNIATHWIPSPGAP